LDASPVVQLNAFPLWDLLVFLAHPMKLTGLGRRPAGHWQRSIEVHALKTTKQQLNYQRRGQTQASSIQL
ncbi:hypothetical protein, partial [Delftia acidovorans]|uniref:hypothetical protein n=1 Tax=Delftia acidovorans TaxID=80866 RepID=UPI001E5E6086